MGKRPAQPMPMEQRAKQFAPFDALKGFKESNRRVEIYQKSAEFKELSEEQLEDMNRTLLEKRIGDPITVEVYTPREYVRISGKFDGYDEYDRIIKMSGQIVDLDMVFSLE